MISILILTFYIINHISIIILHPIALVFLIFGTKYCLTEVFEQPRGETPAFNVMAIRGQRHAHFSKQSTLLVDVDGCAALRHGIDHMTGKCFSFKD